MYSKIFASMYDGTIVDAGWEAIVTFQQLIILSDPEGMVDMTAEAISRRTTIPLQILQKGLAILALPDPNSRSPAEEGRRIKLIDEGRPWGWQIVNFRTYRDMKSQADRREYMRDYMRQRREEEANGKQALTAVAPVSNVKTRIRKTQTQTQTQTHEDLALGASPPVELHSTCRAKTADIERVFDHWRTVHGHQRAQLDDKRRKLVRNALTRYTAEDLCEAISGYRNSPHHMGKNNTGTVYDSIDLLLRDAQHIDAGIRFAQHPPLPQSPQDRVTASIGNAYDQALEMIANGQ